MKTEDVIFGQLWARYPEHLAAALGKFERVRVRPLPVGLPTVKRVEADFAVEVIRPAPRHILHAEHWSARGSLARTAFYHMWYHEATRLPVRTLIVTTSARLANAVPSVYEFRVGRGRATQVPLQALHLWRMSASQVLARHQFALYPFVPVMRASRSGRPLLQELRERIVKDAPSEQAGIDLSAAACYIAARRFDRELVESIFGGVAEMAKTDLGQVLIQQGIEQGIEQGSIAAKQGALIAVLEARFGTLPESLRRRLARMEDMKQLDSLLIRASTAESMEAFKAASELKG